MLSIKIRLLNKTNNNVARSSNCLEHYNLRQSGINSVNIVTNNAWYSAQYSIIRRSVPNFFGQCKAINKLRLSSLGNWSQYTSLGTTRFQRTQSYYNKQSPVNQLHDPMLGDTSLVARNHSVSDT